MKATLLHGAAAAYWASLGEPLSTEKTNLQLDRHQRHDILGAEKFEEAYQEGTRLPVCEIIALALQDSGPVDDHID
jgi:hypothetical protein